MKRVGSIVLALITAALLLGPGPGRAGVGDMILFDAPRGAWLAAVRAGAPMSVVEEREGWRRVRLEGWIPTATAQGTGSSESGGGPEAPQLLPAQAPSATEESGASVRGVLLPSGTGASAGAGLIVMLISDLETFDREHGRAGEECRTRVKEVGERLDQLRADLSRALNSTDNFRAAAQRNDHLKLQIQETEKERSDRIRECRGSADAILDRHAVQKTISDARGTFEFPHVAPGRYRVVATEPAADPPRTWSLECNVAGADAIILDPRRDRSPVDPYWNLR